MVPLGDSYAVISGDGSGVDYAGNTEVAFEFKCPNPDNKRTTIFQTIILHRCSVRCQLRNVIA